MKKNTMRYLIPGWGRLLSSAFCACIFSAAAHAQDAAILRQNTFEVGPFVGMNYGLDSIRVMGGANATYSILPNLLLYGEYSYFPSIQHTEVDSNLARYRINIPLQDINFGVHVRIRIPRTPLVPYVVGGIGLLHSPSRTNTVQTFNELANDGVGAYNSPTAYPVASSTSFAFDYGAGVRWYVRENLGFRGEFKGYVLTGGPLHNHPGIIGTGLGENQIFRATVGFFIQF
jgi:hypothetical protein